MSGAFIMLLILALLLVLPAVLLVREVRALRAAGVSDSQPVCAKCRYRMRGWGSPICPECGSDVREVGIITGSARARGFAGQVAVIATVLVGLASYLVASAMVQQGVPTVVSATLGFQSAADVSLRATIDIKSVQRKPSQPTEVDGSITLERPARTGETAPWQKRLELPRAGGPPSPEALRAALADFAGDMLDARALDAHAADMEAYLARLAIDPTARFSSAPGAATWRPLFANGISVRQPPSVGLAFLTVPALFLLVAAVLADRWFPKPRTEPRDGEWM